MVFLYVLWMWLILWSKENFAPLIIWEPEGEGSLFVESVRVGQLVFLQYKTPLPVLVKQSFQFCCSLDSTYCLLCVAGWCLFFIYSFWMYDSKFSQHHAVSLAELH